MGERRVIDAIWGKIGEHIEYDDCAFVLKGDVYALYTTDFVGEGTHFIAGVNPFTLGKFVAAVNLSDIAAMGGIADHFLLSAFMPGEAEVEFLEEFIKGLHSTLKEYNVRYLGGDMKESSIVGFSGFAVGHVERDKILLRKNARLGDIIAVTGPLGKNAAAYYLWSMGLLDFEEVLKVEPRMREGRELAGRAHAAMDTSDGIIAAAVQMQEASGLGFRIDFESVPVHPLAMEVVEDYDVSLLDLMGFGGEYELIYTAERRIIGHEIGKVTEEKEDYGGRGYESFGKALD